MALANGFDQSLGDFFFTPSQHYTGKKRFAADAAFLFILRVANVRARCGHDRQGRVDGKQSES
ncbi:Uncharacterised protein [Edwardsiella tarda]|uniref:Uncharacterized protein n=1 Tax=Edwardsiella tarda ATCC 23685 TaxID=500638 RepID=D4F2V6_EDWTA|nr:hypothetical protein EDWATA_01057 [Edwardsiella tarda ATCC 23685]STD30210.1 Uncharacterised protein [Edwardsiella tarda]STD48144.1 Uncharacterised protein [Edwardsiella tarda]